MNRVGRIVLLASILLTAPVLAEASEELFPAPAETLFYDDGSPESYQSLGDYMCELMPAPSVTPYPFDIVAVLWNTNLTGSFTLQVWDDDGTSGLPGTVLHSQSVNPPSSGWFEVTLSSPITVTGGLFYVGCATVQGIGFDETNPDYDGAYVDVGFGWEPFWYYGPNGDFLIRAVIEPTPLQNDVGVVELVAPDTLVEPNQPVAPEVVVENFGTADQDTVPVWCLIDSSAVNIYSEVDTVFSLVSGDTTRVLFPVWTPDGSGNIYDLTLFTTLTGDEDSTNDTLSRTVETIMHDCGLDTIFQPPDTVYIDDYYSPIVMVHNYGSAQESLDVTCEIDSYADTFRVLSVLPGEILPCTLNPWQVPLADDTTYIVTAAALLPGDGNSANDTLVKQVYAYNPHDVGVLSILSPPSFVVIFDWYPVEFTVMNFGDVVEESVLAMCTIEPAGYRDSVFLIDLEPSEMDVAQLADWQPLPGPLEWQMQAYTLLPLDGRTENDTLWMFIYETGVHQLDTRPPSYRFHLFDPSPSPFSTRTEIAYTLPSGEHAEECMVSLKIYDTSGRCVRTLAAVQEKPGRRSHIWDGRDDSGRALPTGVYFCRLQAGRRTSIRKAVIVR